MTAPVLPRLLAGPLLRDTCADYLTLWFVSSVAAAYEVDVYAGERRLFRRRFAADGEHAVRVGERAWIYCLRVQGDAPLPEDALLGYELRVAAPEDAGQDEPTSLAEELAPLAYPGAARPQFVVRSRVGAVLHGSCRKPHHDGDDGLRAVDDALAALRAGRDAATEHPSLLMMSGDQVYVDDVAGPVLSAVRQVVELLGLAQESLPQAAIGHASQLDSHPCGYYGRAQLLPDVRANETLRERFFGGSSKPIFTTQNADNHLIALSEVLALYFLVWSPVLWERVDWQAPAAVRADPERLARFQGELPVVQEFAAGLAPVRRALANLPVYMIFDDHDVTDDWNLSRSWEESAYGNAFSRRIIGNALIGYGLCQGWGNRPQALGQAMLEDTRALLPELDGAGEAHDRLIGQFLAYEGWSYALATTPKVVVLDTRTRRWRAESNAGSPSGLMDWEALSETQQQLLDEPAVILVSPAPIFGVKLIEVIQRVFSWCGYSLMVDAENWMAHPGSANVILNIFRHKRTPHHFTILSGDVHYSFVYDVRLRHREASPHIWQITSSGIRNRFPARLIRVFDRLNRWLFASRSPLNWFTRRRHMRVRPRRPSEHPGRYRNQRLLNACGVGRVVFDEQGAPVSVDQLVCGADAVEFLPGYEAEWVE